MLWDDENCTICCAKNVRNHTQFVLQKMLKITLFSWMDFSLKFTLVEGSWSIPCLVKCQMYYSSFILNSKNYIFIKSNAIWYISSLEIAIGMSTFVLDLRNGNKCCQTIALVSIIIRGLLDLVHGVVTLAWWRLIS